MIYRNGVILDILKIKNRYWKLAGNYDPALAKSWIKFGLRETNATADRFIIALNNRAGFKWVGEEIFTNNKDHYKIIYSPKTLYMWVITLSSRNIELRMKNTNPTRQIGSCWNRKFSISITRS